MSIKMKGSLFKCPHHKLWFDLYLFDELIRGLSYLFNVFPIFKKINYTSP